MDRRPDRVGRFGDAPDQRHAIVVVVDPVVVVIGIAADLGRARADQVVAVVAVVVGGRAQVAVGAAAGWWIAPRWRAGRALAAIGSTDPDARRRGWALATQLALLLSIGFMGHFDPAESLRGIVVMVALLSGWPFRRRGSLPLVSESPVRRWAWPRPR